MLDFEGFNTEGATGSTLGADGVGARLGEGASRPKHFLRLEVKSSIGVLQLRLACRRQCNPALPNEPRSHQLPKRPLAAPLQFNGDRHAALGVLEVEPGRVGIHVVRARGALIVEHVKNRFLQPFTPSFSFTPSLFRSFRTM